MEIKIFEEDGEHTLRLADEHADFTMDVYPELKTYHSRMSIKDDVYYRTQKLEYRIKTDPVKVEERLIERVDEPPEQYCVKDGVVLESDIRNEHKLNPDEFIDNLKKEVAWHENWVGDAVSMYLLSKHPDIISPDDYRRCLRQLSEKIKTATQKAERALQAHDTGLQVVDGEFGRIVWYPKDKLEKLDDKELEKLREHASKFREKIFDEKAPEYIGIPEGEFRSGGEILKNIDVFLNKKPAKKKEDAKVSLGIKFAGFVVQWIWLFSVVSLALWLLSLIINFVQYNFTFAVVASGFLTFFLRIFKRTPKTS